MSISEAAKKAAEIVSLRDRIEKIEGALAMALGYLAVANSKSSTFKECVEAMVELDAVKAELLESEGNK